MHDKEQYAGWDAERDADSDAYSENKKNKTLQETEQIRFLSNVLVPCNSILAFLNVIEEDALEEEEEEEETEADDSECCMFRY